MNEFNKNATMTLEALKDERTPRAFLKFLLISTKALSANIIRQKFINRNTGANSPHYMCYRTAYG